MALRKSGRDIHGVLLLDKRAGVSSNQALQEVRRLFMAKKAGHSGSLDPLATGVLPLCFGEATKICGLMLHDDKRYRVEIKLGIATATGDAEGEVINTLPVPQLSEPLILNCLQQFIGVTQQVPPLYSALKFRGKKLCDWAREGHTEVERKARRIEIYACRLLDYQPDRLWLDVHCSKGTYIRTLAEDIGLRLGTCATVAALRRTVCGRFTLAETVTLDQLTEMDEHARLNALLAVDVPLESMPAVNISAEQATLIRHGQQLEINDSVLGPVRMYSEQGFLGLGEMLLNGRLAPRKLFHLNKELA